MRNRVKPSVWSRVRFAWAVVVLALLPVRASQADPSRQKPLRLFSADEARQLQMTEQEWRSVRRTRSTTVSDGPRISIEQPHLDQSADGPTIQTATPANLTVTFEPNRSPVDMSSLEVTARKGFFSKSLTGLLKPYVRGTALQVHDVAIPGGRFVIEITIADRTGAKTVQTYRLLVQEP